MRALLTIARRSGGRAVFAKPFVNGRRLPPRTAPSAQQPASASSGTAAAGTAVKRTLHAVEVVTPAQAAEQALPEQVQVSLTEIAGAAKEGLLALATAPGSPCCTRPWTTRSSRSRGLEALSRLVGSRFAHNGPYGKPATQPEVSRFATLAAPRSESASCPGGSDVKVQSSHDRPRRSSGSKLLQLMTALIVALAASIAGTAFASPEPGRPPSRRVRTARGLKNGSVRAARPSCVRRRPQTHRRGETTAKHRGPTPAAPTQTASLPRDCSPIRDPGRSPATARPSSTGSTPRIASAPAEGASPLTSLSTAAGASSAGRPSG